MVLLMVLDLKAFDFPSSIQASLTHIARRFGTLTLQEISQSSDSSIIWRSISGSLVANGARLISHQWWTRGRSMGKPRFETPQGPKGGMTCALVDPAYPSGKVTQVRLASL